MSEYDFILDSMRWSFSSINTYNTCPQAFKIRYIDGGRGISNAFAEWGTLIHSLLERYFTGELEFYELANAYDAEYEEKVTTAFPENKFCDLAERYYQTGLDFVNNFNGIYDDAEVIAVEERVNLKFDGYPFVGVIDLLLKKDDEFIIVDHKSKSKFKTAKELAEYARQLYLYAFYVKEHYGKWPVKLIFNMVRVGNQQEIKFKEEDAIAARNWFVETIHKIYEDGAFISAPNSTRADIDELKQELDDGFISSRDYYTEKEELEKAISGMSFYCSELCGARETCPLKDQAPKEE